MRKRIDKIRKIENLSHRKVTYCKRKKGLLKKAIELSLLCDLKMFVFIYDKNQRRVIHYASDASQDLLEIFNEENQREYYTNRDYQRVGGRKSDVDGISLDETLSDAENDVPVDCFEESSQNNVDTQAESLAKDGTGLSQPQDKKPKIFSKKRKDGQITSRIGDLLQQKLPIPQNCKQMISIQKKGGDAKANDIQIKENEGMEILDRGATNELGKLHKEQLAKIKNSWDIASTHKPIQNSLGLQAEAEATQHRHEQSVKSAQMEFGALLGKRQSSIRDHEIQESED